MIAVGDIYEDRDKRSNGRRLKVVRLVKKPRTVTKRNRFVTEYVDCAECINIFGSSTRTVKIRLDELVKRFRKVT